MSPSQIQIAVLFTPLEGLTYTSYSALETAVRERFRAERRRFPSDFTYRDAISWATTEGWLAVRDGELAVGDIPSVSDAA